MNRDPVCGMNVDERNAQKIEKDGKTYYFCSDKCRDKFVQENKNSSQKDGKSAPIKGKQYTCPMHPEIMSDKPGDCPKCGMNLEQKSTSAGGEDNKEAHILARKFWIGLILAVPVFLLAIGEMMCRS